MTFAATCAVAVAIPVAGAIAGDNGELNSKSVAAKACAAEKKADKAAFNATYGEHAMRDCIKGTADEAGETVANAAQTCKAERDADPTAFAATYGTNANGRNALGKCVSAKVAEEVAEEAEEFDNAAQQCRDERAADPAAFTEQWGTNTNKRNAFGKCVSKTAKELEETPEEPAPVV
jgi:hypothetical protein